MISSMDIRSLIFAVATSMFAASMSSAATQAPSIDLKTAIQRSIDRGKAMYWYDRAAWVTSDDLKARLPIDRQPEIGGWIVTPSAQGLHVDFFGRGSAADRAIYSAEVARDTISKAIVYPALAEPELSETAQRMVSALRSARAELDKHADWHPCVAAPFNSIVLPPDEKGTVPVYFLTPQTDLDAFPFGGHYEIDISREGKAVFSRPFTKSCITLKNPSMGEGKRPVALVLTHLLDPHPTEIHVFEQYYTGIPLIVGTGPKTIWKVESGTIADVSAELKK